MADRDTARRMADDLGKHAARELQEVVNRHMRVAEKVLDSADRVMVLLNLANGVATGAPLYGMQLANDDVKPEEMADLAGQTLTHLFEAARPMLMAEFDKRGRAGANG